MMNKLSTLKTLLEINDTAEDTLLNVYLSLASNTVLNRMYPFGIPDNVVEVPNRYELLQVRIAEYLYQKRGAEGEKKHDENGINRTYESADVPESMLSVITPYAKVG